VTTIVFLLEEASAKDLLEGLLPRLFSPMVLPRYVVFEGKSDLERQMTRKLRGWLAPDSVFVVLRDQDAGDCRTVKQGLVERAADSGREGVLVRVACREIESWILGDWEAVAQAFDRPQLALHGRKAIYRDPDHLAHPVEELRKHIPEYQKRDGARRLGHLLDPSRNQSRSFQAFCSGLGSLLSR
jgi:hypothetical protein